MTKRCSTINRHIQTRNVVCPTVKAISACPHHLAIKQVRMNYFLMDKRWLNIDNRMFNASFPMQATEITKPRLSDAGNNNNYNKTATKHILEENKNAGKNKLKRLMML